MSTVIDNSKNPIYNFGKDGESVTYNDKEIDSALFYIMEDSCTFELPDRIITFYINRKDKFKITNELENYLDDQVNKFVYVMSHFDLAFAPITYYFKENDDVAAGEANIIIEIYSSKESNKEFVLDIQILTSEYYTNTDKCKSEANVKAATSNTTLYISGIKKEHTGHIAFSTVNSLLAVHYVGLASRGKSNKFSTGNIPIYTHRILCDNRFSNSYMYREVQEGEYKAKYIITELGTCLYVPTNVKVCFSGLDGYKINSWFYEYRRYNRGETEKPIFNSNDCINADMSVDMMYSPVRSPLIEQRYR